KAQYTFPDEYSHPDKIWHAQRLANEAINNASAYPCGPVHINIPIREPFYPEPHEKFSFNNKIQLFDEIHPQPVLPDGITSQLRIPIEKYRRILIVPGQQRADPQMQSILDKLIQERKAV